ncbi:MAG: helix-turn-helix domain-containing protein [Bryobacterales bacterium]|nr:helix-turn-helix domain-containing protein [Bryobacterales bacterium]
MDLKAEISQLAALRQARGLSLEEIAKQTKIASYYLQAIEALEFAKLPGGIYRDTFLKQYAAAINEEIADEIGRKLRIVAREEANAEATRAATDGVLRRVKETLARGAALALLFGHPGSILGQKPAAPSANVQEKDPRYKAMIEFWQKHKCPIENLTADFLAAADRHGLDWRLLPSIVFVESSGGKHGVGANMMGWGSGKIRFRSATQAIFHISERLANSPIYAGKDVRTKLKIYNPANPKYADRIFQVMEQLGPNLMAVTR